MITKLAIKHKKKLCEIKNMVYAQENKNIIEERKIQYNTETIDFENLNKIEREVLAFLLEK